MLSFYLLFFGVFLNPDGERPKPEAQETLAESMFRRLDDPRLSRELLKKPDSDAVLPPPIMPSLPDSIRLEKGWQSGPNCGPVSLFFLLRLLGYNVDRDEVLNRVSVTAEGCSLADLQAAAAHFGMKTKTIKFTPEDRLGFQRPYIIHWIARDGRQARDHFDVVVRNNQDGSAEIIDGTDAVAKQLSARVVVERMSGYALIPDESAPWWLIVLWIAFAGVGLGCAAILLSDLFGKRKGCVTG